MSLYQDKQTRGFLLFLFLFVPLFIGAGTVLVVYQASDMKALWFTHDGAVTPSSLEQSVSKETIATALTDTEISEDGQSLLTAVGLGKQAETSIRSFLNQFQ